MRIISFDLDGTLVSSDFVNEVWLEKIPEIYAKENGISIKDAKEYIEKEYLKIGERNLEWYDIKYWLKKFNLNHSYKEIFEECRNKLKLYPEVEWVLNKLKNKYLIIISNAAREFIEFEVSELNLKSKFKKIFSSVSDFGRVKKDGDVYKKICKFLEIECNKMIHIGDNLEFDYMAAKQAGIEAFYLDRKSMKRGEYVVRNLKEFYEKIKRIGILRTG